LSARAWSGASSARTRAWVSAVVEFIIKKCALVSSARLIR
jgi:hypothetical protein